MAIKIGSNFAYNGKLPNFERDSFKDKTAMKAFNENSIDEGHLSYCKEDGNIYQFKSSNSVDATTGRWRIFKTDIVVDATLNGTSTNPIQNQAVFKALKLKADAVALSAYQPKYNADYIATKDFNYSELPAATTTVDLNGYSMTVFSTASEELLIRQKYFYNGKIVITNKDGVRFEKTTIVNSDIDSKVKCSIIDVIFYNCTINNVTFETNSAEVCKSEVANCTFNDLPIIWLSNIDSPYPNITNINNEESFLVNVVINGVGYKKAIIKNNDFVEAGYESGIYDSNVAASNAPSCEAVKDALQLKADKTQLNGLATKTELNSKADASALDNYTTTATTNTISADVTSLMNEVFVLTATASVSPNIAEVGTNPTVTLTVDAKLGKGRTQVDEITIDGTKYTGEIPYTHSVTATTTHTYNITVKKGAKTADASAKINFYNASYYGVVDASKTSLTATEVKTLKTKEVKSGRSGERTFNLTNQKACIAYPKAFGAATGIKDANGFDYLASYTRSELNVNGELYYVYLLTNTTTITDMKQTVS